MTNSEAKDIANKADNSAVSCRDYNLKKGIKSFGDGPEDFTPSNQGDMMCPYLSRAVLDEIYI